MSNQPPYQNWSSDPNDPPSGSPYASYPYPDSQEYRQSGPGYGSAQAYEQSGSGYGQPVSGYVPPPGQGYASPGYGQPASGYVPPPVYPGVVYVQSRPDPGRGMAITGFVLGIISVCLLCLTTFGAGVNIVVATLGIIFSVLGKKSSTAHGLAIAGLVLSLIGAAVSVLFFLVLIGILSSLWHMY